MHTNASRSRCIDVTPVADIDGLRRSYAHRIACQLENARRRLGDAAFSRQNQRAKIMVDAGSHQLVLLLAAFAVRDDSHRVASELVQGRLDLGLEFTG